MSTKQPKLDWRNMKRRYVGKVFRRRVRGEKQETRKAIDVTLGGSVEFSWGPRLRYHRTVSQEEWLKWCDKAKDVTGVKAPKRPKIPKAKLTPKPIAESTETYEPARYMVATVAKHQCGEISRPGGDLCVVGSRVGDHYVGNWLTGFGFFNVKFPVETTRKPTDAEIEKWRGKHVGIPGSFSHPVDLTGDSAKSGVERIEAQHILSRQVGYTYADSAVAHAELSQAALVYLRIAAEQAQRPLDLHRIAATFEVMADHDWPSSLRRESFKPAGSAIGNLILAGDLIAREIDRLLRREAEKK